MGLHSHALPIKSSPSANTISKDTHASWSVMYNHYYTTYLVVDFWRTNRCLIVGLPCGQFHGASRVSRLSRTLHIVLLSRVWPIMMEDRHALDANIALTLVGLMCLLLRDCDC